MKKIKITTGPSLSKRRMRDLPTILFSVLNFNFNFNLNFSLRLRAKSFKLVTPLLEREGPGVSLMFICFSILLLASSCTNSTEDSTQISALPYYNEATFTPKWFNSNDKALESFHQISPFQLTNQEGEEVTEKTFEGKIYITDFFFTICPGICPKMMKNMGILQDEFLKDNDVLLLSHSVTPEMDSVSVLKKYAEAKGILSEKWHLVTGPQQDIYKLGRKDYFVEEDLGVEKELDEFLHTENFVLIDGNRHIRGIYNGLNKASVRQLIKDVRTLKKEI